MCFCFALAETTCAARWLNQLPSNMLNHNTSAVRSEHSVCVCRGGRRSSMSFIIAGSSKTVYTVPRSGWILS